MATVKIITDFGTNLDVLDRNAKTLQIEENDSFNIDTESKDRGKTCLEDLSAKPQIIDAYKIAVSPKTILPFRVKFTNIDIPGYGPSNVPPIGIAIIGVNNYIL